jgi:hypothetical protein
MWDVWRIRDMHTGKPEKKDHLEDIGVEGIIILKWVLKKLYNTAWIQLIHFKIGTSCRLF